MKISVLSIPSMNITLASKTVNTPEITLNFQNSLSITACYVLLSKILISALTKCFMAHCWFCTFRPNSFASLWALNYSPECQSHIKKGTKITFVQQGVYYIVFQPLYKAVLVDETKDFVVFPTSHHHPVYCTCSNLQQNTNYLFRSARLRFEAIPPQHMNEWQECSGSMLRPNREAPARK